MTIKRALTAEQLKHVASLNLNRNKPLEFTRDMFMASFYLRGIPFVDLIYLTHKNIIGNVICYHRRKTSSRVMVEIIPQLQELIDRYATEGGFLFPLSATGRRTLNSLIMSIAMPCITITTT